MSKRGRISLGLCLAVALVGGLLADLTLGQTSRKMMNLQGRLTDTDGNPTAGNHLFELGVWDGASGGARLYYEAQIIPITKGIYNVMVGDGYTAFSGTSPANYQVSGGKTTGIPATVFNRDNLWLEIEIDEDNPLSPRTRVVSSAFAFNADTLDGRDWNAAGDVTATGLTATDGNVTNLNTTALSFTGGGSLNSSKVQELTGGTATALHTHGGGGITQRGYDQDPDAGSGYTGTTQLFSVGNFNKTSASSTLRITYSDTLYMDSYNQECYFEIDWRYAGQGWNRVCQFYTNKDEPTRAFNWNGWGWWGGHHHYYQDTQMMELPITNTCVQAGLGVNSYEVRVVGWRGSNGTCYYNRAGDGFLIVDEVF